MYTPIDDRTTIDKRISKFIERKSPRTPWNTFKKTIVDWRTSSLDQHKAAKGDIAYEPIDWPSSSFSHTSYRKVAS